MCVRSSNAFYGIFNLDMGRSPGFGSAPADCRTIARRPLKTRFPCGSAPSVLNLASRRSSPDRSTKSTRFHLIVVPQLVNVRFQVLFHSPPGVLFTFPSQYYALSVTEEYLALEGGPSDFPQGFPCLVVLWILPCAAGFRLRVFHPLRMAFPKPFGYPSAFTSAVLNPGMHASRFGLFPFRSPLLRKSMFLSFPPAT